MSESLLWVQAREDSSWLCSVRLISLYGMDKKHLEFVRNLLRSSLLDLASERIRDERRQVEFDRY